MNELITSMEPMLTKLSETFCISIDAIRTNTMQYILEYGRYHLGNSLVESIIAGLILGAVLGVMMATIGSIFISEWLGYNEDVASKKAIRAGIIVAIMTVVLCVLSAVVPYLLSPTMYSINAVIDLVK